MSIARARRLIGSALATTAGALLVMPIAMASAADGVGDSVPGYGVLDWLNLGIRLALVIAVIWGAIAALRWYMQRMHGGGPGSGGVVHVLETRTLGPNRALHLVQLGDRIVLVGATAERINRLSEIEDADEVASMLATVKASRSAQTLPAVLGGVGPIAQIVRERALQVGSDVLSRWRGGVQGGRRDVRASSPSATLPDLAGMVPTVRTAQGRPGVRLADLEAAMRTHDDGAGR